MRGDLSEQWAALVEEVRQAPSPAESPALARLFELAIQVGAVKLSKFRQLGEGEREDLVREKFLDLLPGLVAASNPWGLFVTAIVHAAIDARRRKLTAEKHEGEILRTAEAHAASRDEVAMAETLDMQACFTGFSPRIQQILRAVAEGEERDDVARVFGTSRANVDQVVSRARKRWKDRQ